MNKASEDKIIDYLCNAYNHIAFCIEGDNYKILAIKIKRSRRGIVYMLCFTFYTVNGYMYKNKGVPAMPFTLFQVISKCEVIGYNQDLNAIPFKLWFKEPLTKKILRSLDGTLDKPIKTS